MILPVRIPGYDKWKLAGPDDNEPSCDWCGGWGDLRIPTDTGGYAPPQLTCEDCFIASQDGPDFDDLPTAQEYYAELEAERGDYLYEQAKDRRMEDER